MSYGKQKRPVGRGSPPVEHQFKPGNQAAKNRRKKKPQKSSFFSGFKDALRQPVQVQRNGKRVELEYGYSLGWKFVQELSAASFSDRVKMIGLLKKEGIIDIYDVEASIDEERRELEERRKELELLRKLTLELNENIEAERRFAISVIDAIRTACSCGACGGAIKEQVELIQEWRRFDEETDAAREETRSLLGVQGEGWAVSGAPDLDEDDDDFYSGMVGRE